MAREGTQVAVEDKYMIRSRLEKKTVYLYSYFEYIIGVLCP
jgi:hypothetical protein